MSDPKPPQQPLNRTLRIEIPPPIPSNRPWNSKMGNGRQEVPIQKDQRQGITESPLGEHFQELLQNVYDAVLITEQTGEIVEANARADHFFLAKPGQLRLCNVLSLLCGAGPSTLLPTILQPLNEKRFVLIQAHGRRMDGTSFPAEISVNLLPFAGKDYLEFFVRDVTLRKEREEQLRAGYTAIQNANSGIAIAGLDARITYCNPGFLAYFGLSSKELEKRNNFRDYLCQPALTDEIIAKVMRRETWAGELELKGAQGKVFFGYTSVTPSLNADGELTSMVLSILDVTAEAANRAKDQFLAVLSHELRTPLTPVLAAVTALTEQKGIPSKLRAELEMIQRNVELESNLIDDLLDVTRISRGKIELHQEAVDTHACLVTTLEIFQKEIDAKRMKVSLDLQATQSYIWADPPRLRQVFWNLLKNAVKFTPEEGNISLRTTNANGKLSIQIADTGIGIAPEVMPRIFNAFEQGEQTKTRRFGGLGLGLSIAKTIVEMHQGTLTACSDGKDQGAVFTLELTPIASPLEQPTGSAAPVSPLKQPLKILLVDDHADTLSILAKLLRKWGCTVITATGVHSALSAAAKESFDLLVSDLGLPDGSGLDIMRQTKELYGLRGIALSGYGMEGDLHQSRAAGFSNHLIKPVSVETLRTTLQEVTLMAAQ